jgi:hypothetical protein
MLGRGDKQIDDMLAPSVHYCRDRTVIEIVETSANQWESFRRKIFDRRCKSEFAVKPGLHRVPIRGKYVREMVLRQGTEMVIKDFAGR